MQSEDTVDTSVSDDNYADMNEDENATTDTAVVLVPYNQISPPSKWNASRTPLKNFTFSNNRPRSLGRHV